MRINNINEFGQILKTTCVIFFVIGLTVSAKTFADTRKTVYQNAIESEEKDIPVKIEKGNRSNGTPNVLEVVVVTGTKHAKDIVDVPVSIVALSGEVMEHRGIKTVDDLSYAVPNLSVTTLGAGREIYIMRGVGNGNGDNALVGSYLDEIPLSTTQFQPAIRTTDMDRVEVLRGPQGTLFGQGSVGGTIRFITKKPEFNVLSGNLGLSTYYTKKGGSSEEFTGILNVPVFKDTLAFRVVSTYENTAGWIDQIDSSNSIINKDINDSEVSNIRLKGLWQTTDNLTISTMAVRHRQNAGGDNVALNSDLNFSLDDSLYQVANVDPSLRPSITDENNIYNVIVTYDFENAVFTGVSSRVDTRRVGELDSVFFTTAQGILPIASLGGVVETEIVSHELRLSSSADNMNPFEWTVGAFLAKTEDIQKFENRVFAAIETGPILPTIKASDSSAFFGDISYAINDQWTIGVGTRIFNDKKTIETVADGGRLDDTFDNISSKLYLSFAVTDDANVYMSASEGFRSGGFNTPFDVQVLGSDLSYSPEELLTYELGSKASWLNDSLKTEVAIYYSDYSDYQAFFIDPVSFAVVNTNASDAKIKGIEWNILWVTSASLSLGFSGNITDSEFTDIKPLITIYQAGDPLESVPEYSYSITADYGFNWTESVPGFIRFEYNEQGESSIVLRDQELIPEVGDSEPMNIFNAHLGMQWESLSVELFGNNLLDDTDGTAASLTGTNIQVRRRSYGISVDYNF